MSKLKYLIITILLAALILPVLWATARGSLFKVSTPAAKGLVGHWALDNVTGAKDKTPNANNGTGAGGITIGGATDQHGQSNRATAFVGASSQKVTTGNVGNLKSVSFWVNASTTSESFLELIDNSAYISVSSGTVSATGFTAPTIYLDNVATTTGFTASAWHLIVVTTGTNIAADSMIIGEANSVYFTGSLADVRIYNRALSATEITSLYNSYRPKQAISSLQKGLVGHWKLDQASNKSTTVTADATPYGNNGTSSGSPTLGGATDQHGQANKATSFNGTSQYVSLSQLTGSLGTISAWIKLSTNNTVDVILAEGKSSASTPWLMFTTYIISGSSYISFYDDANVVRGSTALQTGVWYHVVGVSNGTAYSLYLNGVSESLTLIGSNTGNWFADCAGDTWSIGVLDRSGDYGHFNGSIADVRIYNRALSATEITSLYNSYRPARAISSLYKGLVLDMPLAQADLKSATTIADKTPYSNTGTLVGSPTFTTDRHGQANKAMAFVAGSSQKVTIGNIGNVKSIGFWAKLNSTTEKILELIDDNTYVHNNAGTITATGFTSPTVYVDGAAASTISDTNWHHVVVTTGTNVAAASTTIGEANATYLTGSIHSVKVWNRALSAGEVTALHQSYK